MKLSIDDLAWAVYSASLALECSTEKAFPHVEEVVGRTFYSKNRSKILSLANHLLKQHPPPTIKKPEDIEMNGSYEPDEIVKFKTERKNKYFRYG